MVFGCTSSVAVHRRRNSRQNANGVLTPSARVTPRDPERPPRRPSLVLPFQFRESCRRISGIEECHVKCQRLVRWARNVPRQLRKCIQEWRGRRAAEGGVAAINAEGEAPSGEQGEGAGRGGARASANKILRLHNRPSCHAKSCHVTRFNCT